MRVMEQQPESTELKVMFWGKDLSDVTDLDFALEATQRLGLLNDSAASTIAGMITAAETEHPRAITTRYRKSGAQVNEEVKKLLGVRANAFMSVAAYSELTELGKSRAVEAHEITLLRAVFHRIKVRTLSQCVKAGFDKIRFSASHRDECAFCGENDNVILYVTELSELPITKCSREACSALISPYRDFLGKRN